MVRKALFSGVLVMLAGSLAACSGVGGESVPKALATYLDALVHRDYRVAYDQTSLPELVRSFGPGASVSFKHFAAFYKANPLTRYSVSNVTRLDHRSIDAPAEKGSPFFDVTVELTVTGATHTETITVEGEVLGRVNVEPGAIRVRARDGHALSHVIVDGIDTAVRARGRTYALLLFQGRHTVGLPRGGSLVITTGPLAVVSGPGRVRSDGQEYLEIP